MGREITWTTRLSPSFTLKEFIAGTNFTYDEDFIGDTWEYVKADPNIIFNLRALAAVLQVVRDYFNKPLIITSGVRPVAWELIQGRSGTSYHTKGLAADFYIEGKELFDVYIFIEKTIKGGGRAINPQLNFIHYDLGTHRYRTWTYG